MQPTKTMGLQLQKNVDLRQYPKEINPKRNHTITAGDMHGNVMKLLWILIREGVMEMREDDFKEMWSAYDGINVDPTMGMKREVQKFVAILVDKVKVNPNFDIRLLGDLFADRGGNDYLTLKVFEKLYLVGGVKPKIIFSNHDAYLLDNYDEPVEVDSLERIKIDQDSGTVILNSWHTDVTRLAEWILNIKAIQNSMIGLFAYIKKGIVKQEEVENLVDRYVVPSMILISYALSEDGEKIDLFMHAPNNFDVIKGLAKELIGIDNFEPQSAIELAATIDKINEKFQLMLRNRGPEGVSIKRIIKAINNPGAGVPLNHDEQRILPLINSCIWNRLESTGHINFRTYPNFVSHVIHGHTEVRSGVSLSRKQSTN